MSQWKNLSVLALLIAVLALTPGSPTAAQGSGACQTVAEAALAAVDTSCAGLGRDEACYGHTRVDAAFRQPRDPADFDAPADRVPLADVQALATAPLDAASGTWGVAVMSLRANLPDTMPGQNVTFLLMGSAQIENAVAPGDPALGPMQAFYFTTGLDAPQCTEAPDALAVQSPQGAPVTLRINDLDMQIGSTVVLFLAQIDGQPVMVVVLLDGHLQTNVNGAPVDLTTAAGQPAAFAITLNAAGRVDVASQIVPAPESAATVMQAACGPFGYLGFPGFDPAVCAAWPVPGAGGSNCVLSASRTVNVRGGPNTSYPVVGQIAAGETAMPNGKTISPDGTEWWRLARGGWVRADLVRASGDCASVEIVDDPGGGGSGNGGDDGGQVRHYLINDCTGIIGDPSRIVAGEIIRFATGCCGSATVEEQQAREAEAGPPWITLDGTPLPIYITGIFWASEGWYTNDGRYEWVATPGTHTVSGGWGSGNARACTFIVEAD